MSTDWEDFVAQVEDLLLDIDDLPEAAHDFAEGTRETLEGMMEWADAREHCTEKMWTALENIRGGVERWRTE